MNGYDLMIEIDKSGSYICKHYSGWESEDKR